MIYATFFTGTKTTEKTVREIAGHLDKDYVTNDFSLPGSREKPLIYTEDDVVVFGVPVIAGRVPNLLVKYMKTIQGNHAFAIPIVMYGNRDFDDGLIELRDILEEDGFHTIAAGAFVGEHSFSLTLGKGRPDIEDINEIKAFAEKVKEKLAEYKGMSTEDREKLERIDVDGTPYPYRGYYMPRDRNGVHIDIRKVKPKTDEDKCVNCRMCARICPMGAISMGDVRQVPGICIKCCACVKRCPHGAKYYDDAGFLYHKNELEEMYMRRGKNKVFI